MCFLVPDVRLETRLPDGLAEVFQFAPVALGYQFDPPIQQVADQSDNLKSACHLMHGVAKAHTLDVTGIQNA